MSEEARLIPSPPARVDSKKQNASASGAGEKKMKKSKLARLTQLDICRHAASIETHPDCTAREQSSSRLFELVVTCVIPAVYKMVNISLVSAQFWHNTLQFLVGSKELNIQLNLSMLSCLIWPVMFPSIRSYW